MDLAYYKLPGVSTLKTFTSFNVDNSGFNEDQLSYAREQYDQMVAEKKAAGELVPFSEGILVFDEVKVGLKVHYHAKTEKLVGLAMSSDELGSLHDVYQTLQPDHKTQKASYILQYLWRCTASNFDILGLYYSSAGGAKAKYILSNLYDTIHIFQLYGFVTKVIVCDGASNNLAAIKMLTGLAVVHMGTNPSEVVWIFMKCKPGSLNPYTKNKVFTIVCPSHQVYMYFEHNRVHNSLSNWWCAHVHNAIIYFHNVIIIHECHNNHCLLPAIILRCL